MTMLTVLTSPTRPEADVSLPPLPWRRMAWITWRQHRVAFIGIAVLLGALAVYLWIEGRQIHHAYAVATACGPASSAACGYANSRLYRAPTTSRRANSPRCCSKRSPRSLGRFSGPRCWPASWRRAPSATPGPKASGGGDGRLPSLSRSLSSLEPPPSCSACCSPGTTSRSSWTVELELARGLHLRPTWDGVRLLDGVRGCRSAAWPAP